MISDIVVFLMQILFKGYVYISTELRIP